MPLQISRALLQVMVKHARRTYPDECCGVLLGRGSTVLQLWTCWNTEQSSERFNISPRELAAIEGRLRENDWDMVAVYHSHPFSEAYPSLTDIRLASYPGAFSVIVSLQELSRPAVRAYKITDQVVTEDVIESADGLQTIDWSV